MKKILIGSAGLVITAIVGLVAYQGSLCIFECPISCKQNVTKQAANQEQEIQINPRIAQYIDQGYKRKEEEGYKGAAEYMHKMRANQETGIVNMKDVYNARQQIQSNQNASRKAAGQLDWQEMGPDDIGGRCRAILIDQNDPQKMWAGGVTGGLFYSTNGGASWQEHDVNYKMTTTLINCITQAPNGDIYFGTGEVFQKFDNCQFRVSGDNQQSTIAGEGVYKSTDGGQTFSKLSTTSPSNPNSSSEGWAYVNEIAADPTDSDRIFAATMDGLRYSTDGGQTWSLANSSDIQFPNSKSFEVAIGPYGTVHAAIGSDYYRATNGTNFTMQSGQGGYPSNNNQDDVCRIEFATSPSDENYVYSIISNSQGGLQGIYKSIDNGVNWQSIAPSASSGTFNPLGQQGIYDITIQVDPSNKNRIYVGGQLELWNYSPSDNWNMAAFWQGSEPTDRQYVHADMHEIQFNPDDPSIMYVGTDGGIFQSKNAGQQFPDFVMRNKGFNVTQFYAATGAMSGRLIGGTQDNGTREINYQNNTPLSSEEVKGGDGGDVAVSTINPRISFAEYVYGSVERSTDGGQNYTGFFSPCVDLGDAPGQNDGPDAEFIAPISLWEKETPKRIGKETINTNNGTNASNLMQDSVLIEVRTTILWDSMTVKPKSEGSFIMMLKERQNNNLVQLDTFQATPDQDRINVDWSIESGQYYIVAKDISTNGLFRENLSSNPFPYNKSKFISILGNTSGDTTNYNYYYDWKLQTPNPSIFMVGGSGGVYYTDDAINVGAQPTWYFVSHPGNTNVTSITNTDDGTFYFGTQIGDIYRLDGLAEANYWKIEEDSCFQNIQTCQIALGENSCSGISLNQITNSSSFEGNARYVTGMDANPHNKDQLVVTLGNYGNSNYVYLADNAGSVSGGTIANFSSIQGDLPPMPVYDPLVEYYKNDSSDVEQLFLGTEMGVWSTDRANTSNVAWKDESSTSNKSGIKGMPRVPTFTIREKPLRDRKCRVIYAGTHGRGIFRSVSITKKLNMNCDLSTPDVGDDLTSDKDENVTTDSSIDDFSFYPNPVIDQGIVEYKLKDVNEAKLHVVNLLGQTVKIFNLQGKRGAKEKITLDFTDVSGGTYLLSIDASGDIKHTTKIVVSE